MMTTTKPIPQSSRLITSVPASADGKSNPTHLYELVSRRAESYPSAVVFGSQQGLRWRTVDSRELLQLVDRMADELATRQRVQSGDRVVLWVPNDWRTPVYLFALWKLGAIVVPFDHEMNPDAASSIIDSVQPRCVLVGYGERPVWARQHAVVEWWEPQRPPVQSPVATWIPPTEEL